MRPKGEIHHALLKAVGDLATPDRGATLREIAERACVGTRAARYTLGYMHRIGVVVIARTRKVPYRNRPVSEYALPTQTGQSGPLPEQGMAVLLAAWGALP